MRGRQRQAGCGDASLVRTATLGCMGSGIGKGVGAMMWGSGGHGRFQKNKGPAINVIFDREYGAVCTGEVCNHENGW